MLNGILSGTRIMTQDGIKAEKAKRRVLDVADVVKLEQAIAAAGTPLDELMRRAGASVAQEVEAWVPEPAPVVVLCGAGNNGGDGWVCARLLARAGRPVTVVTPREAAAIKAWPACDEAQATCTAIAREGLPIKQLIDPDPETLAADLAEAAAIVDALLGTGFSGTAVKEPLATWVELANARRFAGADGMLQALAGHVASAHGRPPELCRAKDAPFALAVDAPSGLSAQTGTAAQPCFQADETVTMLALKPGLLEARARPYTGSIELAELACDDEIPERAKADDA